MEKKSMAPRRNDNDIIRDVSETLTWDTRVNDEQIEVTSHAGKVTLTGTVPLFSEKTVASEDSWRIKGVREVINNLIVSPSDLRLDKDILTDVIKALERDTRVNTRGITVDVVGSIVRLSGAVSSLAKKNAAVEDSWYTPGVVDVEDDLSVNPQRIRSDNDIAADIASTIQRDVRISEPERINVSVVKANVFLRGGVDSMMERQAAEEDARFTAGARDVMNEIALVSD
jgi:osmotically-inducible protein OsmY